MRKTKKRSPLSGENRKSIFPLFLVGETDIEKLRCC